MNWTPEQDNKLREMWLGKGWPASWIGRELSVSRSAVIGRVHRLNIQRDEDKRRKAKQAEEAKASARADARRKMREAKSAMLAAEREMAALQKQMATVEAPRLLPLRSGATIMDIRACDCRYALWGHSRPPLAEQFYCGQPALPGRSWCAAHVEIVFRPLIKAEPSLRRAHVIAKDVA